MQKILAIDYGTKRVGLAISRVGLAQPLTILANDEFLLEKITTLVEQEKIELVLIGMSENTMATKTQKFSQELEKKMVIPIQFIDETLSSYQVHHKLATSHMKQKKRQQPIDHFAAAEILQEWLEMN